MWPESGEQPKKLKTGLTTGSCATACCVAAARFMFVSDTVRPINLEHLIEITLPKDKKVSLTICNIEWMGEQVVASTIKDAGDDPDVTHGAKVSVALKLTTATGIFFHAGDGVGTVTREGLALAVGEPAINPVPRKMMTEHLEAIADEFNYQGGFSVTVAVEGGENLALKTMNPRLGILGGLSILGTTGIVRPFSCSAYIASIHQGIDVARANGIKHIAATTGNQSETAIREQYHLTDMALIEMGDFVGAVLKYLKKAPVERLSLCGGFGKISKLAQGHLDLHSRASSIDFDFLADLATEAGASEALKEKVLKSNTSIEALNHCQKEQIELANLVCIQAMRQVRKIIPSDIVLDLWVVNRQGEIVGSVLNDADLRL
jgi:cobalt-precorrin-5B (C1)-methyltransferase